MRIIFMGSPEFAIPPLEHLIFNGHEVAAVYTPPDKPAGRSREPVATAIKNAALSWKIPVVQVRSLKTPEAVKQMVEFRPEAIVVAAFGQILPQAVLELPCYGCLNIHPSLLPKYRGPSPVPSTILAGDEFAGVSVMRLDAGMDTGPIFSRAQISISPYDNSESLLIKLFQIGARMLAEVIEVLPWGKLMPEPQQEAEASYTKEIIKEEGRIDWQLSAVEIWRRVRAYQPWPGAYTFWMGKQLKIIEAFPMATEEAPQIGQVMSQQSMQDPAVVRVGTGNGILCITRVQIEGKRTMSAGEFLRGQRDFMGAVLG